MELFRKNGCPKTRFLKDLLKGVNNDIMKGLKRSHEAPQNLELPQIYLVMIIVPNKTFHRRRYKSNIPPDTQENHATLTRLRPKTCITYPDLKSWKMPEILFGNI